MKTGRHNRNLWLVEAGWGCWVAADLALLVMLAVVAFRIGGVGAVGLVGAARVLPGALLGPFVVPVTDRMSRTHLLVLSHAFAAAMSLVLAWAAVRDSALVLVLVVGLGSLAGSIFKAVLRAAIIQVVVSPADLVNANAAYAAIEGLGTVVGPVLGGALVAVLGASAGLGSLTVIYLAGAALSALVRTAYQVPARVTTGAKFPGMQAFRLLAAVRVRWLVGVFLGQCFMRGLLTVFIAAFCLAPGGGGENRVAALFATLGLGGLVGAWLCSRSPGRTSAGRRAAIGVALWGAPIAALGIWPQADVAWVALAVVGLGNAMEDVYGLSVLDRVLPEHLAARAYALFWSVSAGLITLGSLLGPVLVSSFGLGRAMWFSGAALVFCCVLVLPTMKGLDARVGQPPPDLALVRATAQLSALPDMAVERLARSLRRRELYAGEVVLRQGDAPDGFGIVARGTLRVMQGPQTVRELSRGASFGEVGLLMERPRTASVVAVDPAVVLWLDAATFVAAVTGHRDAAAAAMNVAHGHLNADEERISPPHRGRHPDTAA